MAGLPVTEHFVQRTTEMAQLDEFFKADTDVKRRKMFVVHGLGGIGKTQLCIEYFRRNKEDFTAVFWLDGSSKDTLSHSLASVDRHQTNVASEYKVLSSPGEGESYAAGGIAAGTRCAGPDMRVGGALRNGGEKAISMVAVEQYPSNHMDHQNLADGCWTNLQCRRVHFGHGGLQASAQKQRLVVVSRIASKSAVVIAAPMCFYVMRIYAVSRGLLLPAGSQSPENKLSCSRRVSTQDTEGYAGTDQYKDTHLFGSEWLQCPNALLFLAASMSAGVLLVQYHQLTKENEVRGWLLATLTFFGIACGVFSGLTFVATNLTITPWAVLIALLLSDLSHSLSKARRVRKMRILESADAEHFQEPTEKA